MVTVFLTMAFAAGVYGHPQPVYAVPTYTNGPRAYRTRREPCKSCSQLSKARGTAGTSTDTVTYQGYPSLNLPDERIQHWPYSYNDNHYNGFVAPNETYEGTPVYPGR